MHSVKELINLSKKGDFWYSWGDVYMQGCVGFAYGFARAQKSYPIHLELYVFSFENDHGYEAVSLNDASRVANYYFNCWKERKEISKIEESWKREDLKLSKILSQLNSIKLKKLESEELYNLYHTIQEIHEKFWENIMVSEAVAAFEENLLLRLIEKKFGFSQKDFLDLGANFYLGESIVQKYQRSLSDLKQPKNSEKFDRLLSDHIKNFYWIRSGFHGYEELTPEIVKKEIRVMKFESNPIRTRKIKKNIPQEVKDWLEFLCLMAYWKDEKKRIGMQANYWIFKICEEIAKKKNINPQIIFNTTPEELKAIVFKNKKFPTQYVKRKISFVAEDGKVSFYGGKDHRLIFKNYFDVKSDKRDVEGIVASKTDKKIIRGIAKIIYNPINVEIRKNEILIAPSTRPEYIQLMKKALAVITDQGGLTSHAAIVSRELEISCIIGTRFATTVFKNGDRIEMDMNTGQVRSGEGTHK